MKLPSISKGYVYFAIGILLMTALTSVNLTCPVDGGTGVIKGAEGLKVTDIEDTLIGFETFDTGCAEIYSDFTYSVNISLVNETNIKRFGALEVKFYHPSAVKGAVDIAEAIKIKSEELETPVSEIVLTEETSKGGVITTFTATPVATQLVYVEIPANTAKTVEETIHFRGFGFKGATGFGVGGVSHAVSVAPPKDVIKCPYSHGTGKVNLTEWLRIKAGV